MQVYERTTTYHVNRICDFPFRYSSTDISIPDYVKTWHIKWKLNSWTTQDVCRFKITEHKSTQLHTEIKGSTMPTISSDPWSQQPHSSPWTPIIWLQSVVVFHHSKELHSRDSHFKINNLCTTGVQRLKKHRQYHFTCQAFKHALRQKTGLRIVYLHFRQTQDALPKS